MFYVYVIQSKNTKEFYIGFSTDVESRVKHHNLGENRSTRHEKGNWILVYLEGFRSEKDARARELKLKSHGKGKQELLKRLMNSVL